MRKFSRFLSIPLLLAATPVFAHPGHELRDAGFVAGLLHPLLGVDHLLAMLVVGVWAAQLGSAARWLVPSSFLALMAIGAGLAIGGMAVPHVEAGIAASLLVLGLLATLMLRVSLTPAVLLVGLFALFHGAAHGQELPALAQPSMFAAGFLIATASLHAVGVLLGSMFSSRLPMLARAPGALCLAAGLAFAVSG